MYNIFMHMPPTTSKPACMQAGKHDTDGVPPKSR